MQRTVHCMGFVVEWFIEMQWAALGFGKRLPGFASLYVSLMLIVYSPGHLTLFACTFLAPPLYVPWSSFSFFPCFSIYNSHFSSLFQNFPLITNTSSLFKSFSSLWIPSPPLLYLTQKLQGRGRLCIYSTESSWKLWLFFFLQWVLGRMSSNEPDTLAWFVASVTDIIWPQQLVDNAMLQLSPCHCSFHWYLY